ncbi:MAG: DNA polymerase/3'-5' exonuclease PolX [Candidatus Omnitrophica bacterium]|nr:DNA polymerase/3'-5' exonuclease PolX [Candidatus Omnitrophota bacterium]
MKSVEIARIFRDIAKILEIKGENVFRVRAYERAAQSVEDLPNLLEKYIKEDRLQEIPGIGKELAERIKEYSATGKIKLFEDLKKTIPPGLLELLRIPSVGPKTAKLLFDRLKIKSIASLEKAIQAKKLIGLAGIKERTIENIQKGIAIVKRGQERMTLAQATATAQEFIEPLEKLPEVKRISTGGSLRRRKETVRDVDILIASDKPRDIMHSFVNLPMVRDVTAEGKTKASVRTKNDSQIDCRVVEDRSFGAALMYFTGSKEFNIKIRQLAIKKALKINEYGVFRKDKFICGRTEKEVFKILGLSFIPPELRENSGEIELSLKNKLPKLVTLNDIKGDLHSHSTWSDGNNTIEEMAQAAIKLGYSYIAITDHSQSLKIANGLTPAELKKKKAEIERINKKLKNFRILYGTEVDIDSRGKTDYPDKILAEFDIVIGAIHTGFKQSRAQITKRLVSACKNKFVNIIAHPTGRLWGVREAFDLDIDEIFKAASGTKTCLEINSYPQRLDLNDINCRRAKELGVRISIGTDSHTAQQLQSMQLGVSVARRGWLTSKNIINALPLEKLFKSIRK